MRRTRPFRHFTVAAAIALALAILIAGCSQAEDPTAQPEPAEATAQAPVAGTTAGADAPAVQTEEPSATPTTAADAAIEAPRETPKAETPAAAPAKTQEPDTRPTAGHDTGLTDEPTDQPGRPSDPEALMAAIAALSPEEQACLRDDVREGYVSLGLDTIVGTHHARILREVADCVDDAGITRLMIIPGIEEEIPLSGEERDCMTAGNSGRMVRKVLETDGEYPVFTDALSMAVAGAFINIQDCLGEERFHQMAVSPEQVGMIRCLVRDAQEAEGLTAKIVDGDPDVLEMLEERGQECAEQFSSPGQPECGSGEEKDARCEMP